MNDLINSYPIFQPNQVLTHNNLNNIVDYLAQQERLTRICSIGMGILCGLEVSWEENKLKIAAGAGITSQGYLVHTGDIYFNRYENVPLSLGDLTGETGVALDLEVQELVSVDADEESGLLPLVQNDADGKIALLFFECKEDKNELCGNDCDDKGAVQEFKIRIFLLEEQQAKDLMVQFYQIGENDLEAAFFGAYGKHKLYLERFGYNEPKSTENEEESHKIGRLTGIVDYKEDFQILYRNIIAKTYKRIQQALSQLHTIFASVYVPIQIEAFNLEDLEEKAIPALELQYRYDNLCDIAETYNELLDVLAEIATYCVPNTGYFPKHLFLGKLFEQTIIPSPYRTPYLQAPNHNSNPKLLYTARLLFRRLQLLLANFKVPESASVIITPSKSPMYPLSQRAIPYYYSEIHQNWNAQLSRRGLSHRQYANPRLTFGENNSPYDEPLIYSFLDQDFLRIEGHIGKPYDEVMKELDALKLSYNLGFDIVYLKLGRTFDEEAFQFECDNLEGEKAQYEKLYRQCRQKAIDCIDEVETEIRRVFSRDDNFDLENFVSFKAMRATLPKAIEKYNHDKFISAHTLFLQQITAIERSFGIFNNVSFNLNIKKPIIPKELINDFQTFSSSYQNIQKQIQEIKEQHLFHCFAAKHPGLEHKGGVPIGGTFVMVYVQEQARPTNNLAVSRTAVSKGTVVADFYLPYNCCSNCPPVAYLVDRVVASARVEPSVFCESSDPETLHEIEVIATPPGGFLSGAGLSRQNGKYYFQPSAAEFIDLESGEIVADATHGVARLTYTVDKATADVIIDVLPMPDASFTINDASENVITEICQIPEERVFLSPQEGTYTAFINGEEEEGLITDFQINPMDVDLGEAEEVTLVIRRRISEENTLCDGIAQQNLLVKVVPNANFEIQIGEQIVDTICVEDDRTVQLVPVVAGGKFTAQLVEGSNTTLESVLNDDNTLNPAALREILRENEARELTILIEYTLEQGCGNSSSKELTIETVRDIQITSPESGANFCGNEMITLAALQENVRFTATLRLGDENRDLTIQEGNVLDLSQVTFEAEQEEARVIINAIPAAGNPCLRSPRPVTITVTPVPTITCEASIIAVSNSDDQFIVQARVSVSSGDRPEITFEPTPLNVGQTNAGVFQAAFNYEDVPIGSNIRMRTQARTELCGTVSDEKTIEVIPFVTGFHFFPTDTETSEDGETRVVEILPENLSNISRNIEISDRNFREFQFLNIQALTQPERIGSVRLQLFFEGALLRESVSNTSGNHRLVENESMPGVLPEIGEYGIRATPFGEADAAGIVGGTFEITFVIFQEPQVFSNTGGRIETEYSLDDLLNQRAATYKSRLENLQAEVSKTRFGRAEAFLNFNGSSEQLNQRFGEDADFILSTLKQSKAEKRQSYTDLLAVVTQSYLDKQIAAQPDAISDETKAQIKALKKEASAIQDFKGKALIDNWNAAALSGSGAKKVVTQYKKLF